MIPLGLHHTLSQSFSEALCMLKTNTTALTMAYKTLHTVPLKPYPIYFLLSLSYFILDTQKEKLARPYPGTFRDLSD